MNIGGTEGKTTQFFKTFLFEYSKLDILNWFPNLAEDRPLELVVVLQDDFIIDIDLHLPIILYEQKRDFQRLQLRIRAGHFKHSQGSYLALLFQGRVSV